MAWGTITAIIGGTHEDKEFMATYARDLATQRLINLQLHREVNPGHTDESTDITYDPAGNITSVQARESGTVIDQQCFAYDYQQQLTQAWTPETNNCDQAPTQASLGGVAPYWTSWDTDVTGKTSSRTDRTSTTSTTTDYTYSADGPDSEHPHFITGTSTSGDTTGTGSYAADQAGNTTSRPAPGGGQQTLVWDETNQLTEIRQGDNTIARMVYGPGGERVLRQEQNSTTLYVAGAELTLTTTSGGQPPLPAPTTSMSALRYYTHAGQAIAARTGISNDTVTTLISDHQGTTHHQITNSTGELSTTWQDPYGQPRGQAPASWTGQRGFVGGTKNASGLTRIGVRDYDPMLGRFVTVDPVQDLADPLQWNPYLYANNTPITKADPTGLWLLPGVPCFDTCKTAAERKVRKRIIKQGNPYQPRRSYTPSTQSAGSRPAAAGKTLSYKPAPFKPPVPDPQREFWGMAANIGVGILGAIAVGAVCAATAMIGCLVAGVAIGAAAGYVGYAAQAGITGRYDHGEALKATVLGGALGFLGGLGGLAAKAAGAIGKAAGTATRAVGAAVGKAAAAIGKAAGTAAKAVKSAMGAAASKAGGAARGGGGDMVDIYRAVGPKELADIKASGGYRMGPMNEVKYFFGKESDAVRLAGEPALQLRGGPYALTKGQIPRSVLNTAESGPGAAGEGWTYYLREAHLPHVCNVTIIGGC